MRVPSGGSWFYRGSKVLLARARPSGSNVVRATAFVSCDDGYNRRNTYSAPDAAGSTQARARADRGGCAGQPLRRNPRALDGH
jgi:hypothetical protein